MKAIGFFAGVVIIIAIIAFSLMQKPATAPGTITTQPAKDYKNISYTIENKNVSLVNGVAETEQNSDSASKTTTKYFGNDARGDFNNDGIEDIAFLLTQDGGGSGTFYYLAVALGTQVSYRGTNALLLGDRIAPQTAEFRDGEIIVNYAERKADEPMTASPSVGVSKYFKIVDGILLETN